MATIFRNRVRWTGAPGLPGLSTFYFNEAGHTGNLRTFFEAVKSLIPQTITFTYDAFGDTLDDTTGTINGSWADSTVAATVGTGGVNYEAPTGLLIQWRTNGIVNGRRVNGATFIVPTKSITLTGAPVAVDVATVQAAADALWTATTPHFLVWSRPTASRSGSSFPIGAAKCQPYFTVLRSRRD